MVTSDLETSGDSQDLPLSLMIDLIQQRTGLEFDGNRLDFLARRLETLLQASPFDTLIEYYYFLKNDSNTETEWQRLFSTLAVNETYFWREFDALEVTANWIVPRLLKQRPHQRVRIWHAACASGEEPYSLAIAMQEAGTYQAGRVTIDATDFNVDALEQAQAGRYRERSFRRMPDKIIDRYFAKQANGVWQVSPLIQERVRFSFLNLMDRQAIGQMRNYDIIFCRNVFIYFSEPAIRQVATQLYDSLHPAGVLFTAAAESLLRIPQLFELVEIRHALAYQKRQTSRPSGQEAK